MGLTHRSPSGGSQRCCRRARAGKTPPVPPNPKVPVALNQPVLGGAASQAAGGDPLPGPGGSLGGQNLSRFPTPLSPPGNAPHRRAWLLAPPPPPPPHPPPGMLRPRAGAEGWRLGRIAFPKRICSQRLRLRVGREGFPTGRINGKSPGKAAPRPQGRRKWKCEVWPNGVREHWGGFERAGRGPECPPGCRCVASPRWDGRA